VADSSRVGRQVEGSLFVCSLRPAGGAPCFAVFAKGGCSPFSLCGFVIGTQLCLHGEQIITESLDRRASILVSAFLDQSPDEPSFLLSLYQPSTPSCRLFGSSGGEHRPAQSSIPAHSLYLPGIQPMGPATISIAQRKYEKEKPTLPIGPMSVAFAVLFGEHDGHQHKQAR
jgi:hypothetical protein